MTKRGHPSRPGSGAGRGSGGSWPTVAVVGVTSLISGGIGAGITLALTSTQPASASAKAPRATQAHSSPNQAAAGTIDVSAIAARLDPAVVNIVTTLDPLEGGGAAAGTGMIVSANGEIVTNNHVVQGADTVRVAVPGHGTHTAALVGTDSAADVAVLALKGLGGLPTVRFGSSSAVGVGTPVVAIGNALGLGGSPTITQGIISATGRTITAADATGSNEETLHGLLQTDAPIAPGNSGGPLVDASGQVIGMDTAAASSGAVGASLGFAIPSNTLERTVNEITRHQDLPGLVYGRPPFLGIEVVDSSEIGNGIGPFGSFGPFGFGYGLGPVVNTPNGTPGVVVSAVDPDSPAASAGIQAGDVITSVDGNATPSTTALSKLIDSHRPGQSVSLSLSTPNGSQTVQVRLGAGPID